MIVATLGHVDHGKTALVRALTGVDGDRRPAEKTRGMTIDLGFAWRREPEGLIGFVDVPGHERFARNMLAGVGGIDAVLLVVAADDGVMPQTREHVAIADLLGLARGAVVVTKIDRVEPARVRAVQQQVAALLAGTTLAGLPAYAVSPTRGDGLPALLRQMQAQLRGLPVRPDSGAPARLAVDRAFSVTGTGTVVTGTLFDGRIATGDELLLSPSGLAVRVRRVRIHDQDVPAAVGGQRCALALAGVPLEAVRRGQWLLAPQLHLPSGRIEARIRLPAGAVQGLCDRQPLQFHHGAGAVSGRLVLCRQAVLAPGAPGLATLQLDAAVSTRRGDRFLLRDPAQGRVLAGGVVLDPLAPPERTSSDRRAGRLRALDQPAPHAVLAALAQTEPWWVDLDWFSAAFGLQPSAVGEAVALAGLVAPGPAARCAFTPDRLGELHGLVVAAAAATHEGVDSAALARRACPGLPAHGWQALLDGMVQRQLIQLAGGRVRQAGRHHLPAPAEQLWRRLQPKLARAGHLPPRVAELAERMAAPAPDLLGVLHAKLAQGVVLRVGPDRFMPRQALPQLLRLAREAAASQAQGRFSAARFRDVAGTGRGLAIDLLECLDRLRLTRRVGDLRQLVDSTVAVAAAPARRSRGDGQNWRRRHRFGGSGALHA